MSQTLVHGYTAKSMTMTAIRLPDGANDYRERVDMNGELLGYIYLVHRSARCRSVPDNNTR